MAALRDAYATAGYSIVGAAPTGRGARELQDGAGIPTTIIAALVHRTDPFTAGTVLVIDEAGMINTGDLHAVLQRADGLGISKLVLVGDALQLPEVGAGGGFALAVETAGAGVCELTINRRQSNEWERDALAELRDGDTRHAWNQYMAPRSPTPAAAIWTLTTKPELSDQVVHRAVGCLRFTRK